MISELRITSLGVIESATLPLHPGLNVVTGETGAGKTMVVTGLGLLFGARADAALVRSPAAAAVVEGYVEVPESHPALARAADAGADVGDGLILVRTVAATGRSRAHAGGRGVPVGILGELAENLVAVHGQADQWRLRSGEQQRDLLDAYAGDPLAGALAAYGERLAAWQRAATEHARLAALAASRTADLDVLRAGVERIEAIAPVPGEDAHLRAEEDRLAHADQLRAAAALAASHLLGDEIADQAGAGDLLGRAGGALTPVLEHDPALADLAARTRELSVLISEVGAELSAYADAVEVDDARLAQVQDRRADLGELTRAYGGDLAAVLTWLEQASARLLDVDTAGDRLAAAEQEHAAAAEALAAAAAALTAARRDAAGDLQAAVTRELSELAMGAASLEVSVTPRAGEAAYGPRGVDEVEFLLRAGSGLPARPIARAASGGELSRVMLAIEVVLGDRAASVPTYVFDEVDAGVGGRAAVDIGARLARLARGAQVVVVTHLPQVAAFADRHLVVTKDDDGRVARSDVRVVEADERELELARMMAGSDTTTARGHARELLGSARARRDKCDH